MFSSGARAATGATPPRPDSPPTLDGGGEYNNIVLGYSSRPRDRRNTLSVTVFGRRRGAKLNVGDCSPFFFFSSLSSVDVEIRTILLSCVRTRVSRVIIENQQYSVCAQDENVGIFCRYGHLQWRNISVALRAKRHFPTSRRA